MLHAMLPAAECEALLRAMDEPCPTSLRINPAKASNRVMQELTATHGLDVQNRVPWCADGFYLDHRPLFTLDPLLHAGAYYVQEASSMFVAHLINIYIGQQAVRALDLCAAPGGKSTLIQACLSADSMLTCNEVMPKRVRILQENMAKWGGTNVAVTNMQPSAFAQAGAEFDFILCDVPCSGEGMMRRDEEACSQWTEGMVQMCSRRQREIVEAIWPCLRPGGIMIYSTCTYNTHENEENVAWIASELGADILPVDAPAEWNIMGNLLPDATFPCAHFMPHRVKGEGFFCAIMRKKGGAAPATHYHPATKHEKSRKPGLSGIFGISGISGLPSTSALPVISVDRATALRYLHGEAIHLPALAPRGMVTIAYQGLPLGPAKNIGQRANNLYPKEWRIRMDISQ